MFGALLGAIAPALVGGLLDRSSAKQQQNRAFAASSANRVGDRKWYLDDRKNERLYAERQTAADRKYAEQLLSRDIKRYEADRDVMQLRSNDLAEKTASSRGIDFVKMRDDAVAAGYNPMTAMSMAGAYNKQVDYQLQGAPYSPQANYGGGGGGVSHPPAGGGFMASGGGYQSQFNPALSSGTFIRDAMERATDTYFNTPPAEDKLANALRDALQADTMAEEVRSTQMTQSFGYGNTRVEPFKPAMSVGVPPLAAGKKALTPEPSPSDDSNTPSRESIKVFGRDFDPLSGSSDVAAIEDRYGDIPSGMFGAASLLFDLGANARVAYEKARGRAVHKIDGRYYVQQHDGPSVGAKARDFISTGSTGSRLMRMRGPVQTNRRSYNGY